MAEVRLNDIRPNSDKERKATDTLENKKIKKVVKGSVELVEQSRFKKLLGYFIEEDFASVVKHLVEEMIIPGIKDLIMDGIGMSLGVDARYSYRGREKKGKDYASYNAYYKHGSGNNSRDDDDDSDSGYDYRRIVLDSKGEAELLLDTIADLIEEYDQASVADLYSAIGKTGKFTDNKWGWYNIKGARTRRLSGGRYIVEMPKPQPLD